MAAKSTPEASSILDPATLAAKAAVAAAVAAAMGEVPFPFPSGVSPITPPSEVLTLTEAAEFLRASEAAVRQEAEAGRLPGRTIAGEWRFSRRAIFDWLAAPERPLLPTTNGAELADHIRRVKAASPFRETEEEADAFVAAIYAARKTDSAGGRG